MAEVNNRINNVDCSAIFLSAERGMGATSVLHELASSAAKERAVIALHGTPSLASIPFGILAPYLRRNTSAFVESHVDAIRKMLGLLDEQEAALREVQGGDVELLRPLLILDEANHVDRATAEVVASLTRAGRVKLVIAHPSSSVPAVPLPKLWDDGLVEKFQLQPLSRAMGHDFCAAVLNGLPTPKMSWHFWNIAGGNPLLMKLLMEDALANGNLRQENAVWLMDLQVRPPGRRLQEVVREQLRGLSAIAREMLDLVALSEPVSMETITRQLGMNAVLELFERHLLQETFSGSGVLKLANPVYGEVIRELVPRSQSRMLHRRLVRDLETEPSHPESLLRMVIWSLDSGHQVSDQKLVSAAIFACKLYESGIAMRLVGEVTGAAAKRKALAVKARIMFNMGQYQEAAQLLNLDIRAAESVSDLLFGALLLGALRSALGLAAETIHEDAVNLRVKGEELAEQDPENAADILWRTRERADVLELMALSRAGSYGQMEKLIATILSNTAAPEDSDHLCNRSLALAMDAERLSAIGLPLAARAKAGAAFAIEQAEDRDVFFVPEMIITRAQIASLTAGEWDETEQMLQYLAVDLGKVTVSFGGSVGLVRGMRMLRQGKTAQALEMLLESMEALRDSDPQQLFGFCVSMAAYAAGKAARLDTAKALLGQYREDAGMFIVVAHERAFAAAAHEHVNNDGAGLAELLQIADDCSKEGHYMAELNALSLVMEFDAKSSKRRVAAVAGRVEGTWAAGLATYAGALGQRHAATVVEAAERLLEAQMYQYAARTLRVASNLLSKDPNGHLALRVQEGNERLELELVDEHRVTGELPHARSRVLSVMTRREREIALLAVEGMADRDIAERLHVSVRTIEGHLYRCYAKLGITGREELVTVILG